ncbi:MAG TPA: amino acid ABC transporter permease [Casimicrobiaceae bacterium]|nr:amino acid ABC transporter permease [Casimicrobiaceae bacterium]
MSLLWDARWTLLQATLTTATLFVLASGLALVLSLFLGVARLSSRKWLSWTALLVGETGRGVSLVVQLFWIFFVLPLFGVTLSATTAAVLALGVCFGAYGSEIVRASLLAIPRGQREAAEALGLSRLRVLALVELPQAFVIMLPPLGNFLVLILKSTSVTALITVPELAFTASALNSNFGANIAVFGYVLIAYYAIARLVLWGTRRLELRLASQGIVGTARTQ